MSDLLAFLRARLDEDERVALAAQGGWIALGPDPERTNSVGCHAARWDPARVLAEVQAKRLLLELHAPEPSSYIDGRYVHGQPGEPACAHCADLCHSRSGLSCETPDAPWPCPTVRLLALPYADHPDYRPEWAPDGSEIS